MAERNLTADFGNLLADIPPRRLLDRFGSVTAALAAGADPFPLFAFVEQRFELASQVFPLEHFRNQIRGLAESETTPLGQEAEKFIESLLRAVWARLDKGENDAADPIFRRQDFARTGVVLLGSRPWCAAYLSRHYDADRGELPAVAADHPIRSIAPFIASGIGGRPEPCVVLLPPAVASSTRPHVWSRLSMIRQWTAAAVAAQSAELAERAAEEERDRDHRRRDAERLEREAKLIRQTL